MSKPSDDILPIVSSFNSYRPLLGPDVLAELEKLNMVDMRKQMSVRLPKKMNSHPDHSHSILEFGKSPVPVKMRYVYDAQKRSRLPGELTIGEGPVFFRTADDACNKVYANSGNVWDFYKTGYNRISLDDMNLSLTSIVHFAESPGEGYDNAFWSPDGNFMVYGDGMALQPLWQFTDVVGHEMTHGVVDHSIQLAYWEQSGALNESLADVFGSLLKQWVNREDVHTADWLLSPGIFRHDPTKALRSMKDPTNGPVIRSQPSTMDAFVHTSSDNGGVHTNSGIPNYVFYLVSKDVGGYAWETSGRVWYNAMTKNGSIPDCDFATFANLTMKAAQEFGKDYEKAVHNAWQKVKVI